MPSFQRHVHRTGAPTGRGGTPLLRARRCWHRFSAGCCPRRTALAPEFVKLLDQRLKRVVVDQVVLRGHLAEGGRTPVAVSLVGGPGAGAQPAQTWAKVLVSSLAVKDGQQLDVGLK